MGRKKYFWTIIIIAFTLDLFDCLSTYYAGGAYISYDFSESIVIEENYIARLLNLKDIWSLSFFGLGFFIFVCLLYSYHIFRYDTPQVIKNEVFIKRLKLYFLGVDKERCLWNLAKSILNFYGYCGMFVFILSKIVVVPTNILGGYLIEHVTSVTKNNCGRLVGIVPSGFSNESWLNSFAMWFNNLGVKNTIIWHYRFEVYWAIAAVVFIYLFIYKQWRYSWHDYN